MSLINAISRISARPRQNLLSLRSLSFEHRKRPSRGGQNFTDRYKRLEKSLRGKDAYASESDELRQSTLTGPTSGNSSPGSPSSSVLFHGLTIPDKPQEPADDECCMSGCAVCVYDLYDESLTLYKEAVAKLTATLTSMGVPENEWPASLRSSIAGLGVERKRDVALSAFEEMERRLAEKHATAGVNPIDQEQTRLIHNRYSQVVKMRSRNAWNASEILDGLRWMIFPNR